MKTSLLKADISQYPQYADLAERVRHGRVYPLSLAEGFQHGDIYCDESDRASLFWHYCGFAFVSGEYDEAFLEAVYAFMKKRFEENERRIVLFADNERVDNFFRTKKNTVIEQRCFFEYQSKVCDMPKLPEGVRICEIDEQLMSRIKGRIVPGFSWSSSEEFLANGKGFCAVCGDEVAAWAFSAAVSSTQIDIGIETSEQFRKKGLAFLCAKAMICYALAEKKQAVWACHYQNHASERLALKLGFTKVSSCCTVRIEHQGYTE